MNKFKTMDANEAVSTVAYRFSELCGIYPITPASPMAEKIDILANSNNLNFWNNKVKVPVRLVANDDATKHKRDAKKAAKENTLTDKRKKK